MAAWCMAACDADLATAWLCLHAWSSRNRNRKFNIKTRGIKFSRPIIHA